MSELIKPIAKQKKSFRRGNIGLPFPNFLLGKLELPAICRCIYDGTNFFVTNEKDIRTLYHNGSFGVSNLTFRGPSYRDQNFRQKPYYRKAVERIKLRDKLYTQAFSSCTSGRPYKKPRLEVIHVEGDCSTKSSCFKKSIHPSEDLPDDSDSAIENSMVDEEISSAVLTVKIPHVALYESSNGHTAEEKLILTPEEVIFLSFGVGCLSIQNVAGDLVDYHNIWNNLITQDPEFPILYAVYHYFRSKNWVPKSGISYGAAYVLYEMGPDLYHSTYIVHIIGFPSRPKPCWTDVYSWHRLSKHVSKNVLLCDVTIPPDFQLNCSEPRSIFQFKLKETCLHRWKPASQEID